MWCVEIKLVAAVYLINNDHSGSCFNGSILMKMQSRSKV